MVAILEFVSFVFMHSDNAGICLGGINDNEWIGVFTINIIDLEIYSIVQEGETLRAIGLWKNEADLFITAEIINLNHIVNVG